MGFVTRDMIKAKGKSLFLAVDEWSVGSRVGVWAAVIWRDHSTPWITCGDQLSTGNRHGASDQEENSQELKHLEVEMRESRFMEFERA